MPQIILTFDMVEPINEYKECRALLDGVEVKVDPYVGCVWGYRHFEKGEVTFDGHWWETEEGDKVFLPRRQIFNDNLCANCQSRI